MTYRVIHRGAPRPVAAEFLCPFHGRFEAVVDSGADEAPCPHVLAEPSEDTLRIFRGALGLPPAGLDPSFRPEPVACGEPSPWSPSKAPPMRMKRVEAVRGNHEKAQHKGWCDTSNLEEGQEFDEWQADRDAVAEELRKDLVTEMVRSDR